MINLENAKKLHEVAKENGVELPYSSRATTEFRYPLYTTDELLEWLPAPFFTNTRLEKHTDGNDYNKSYYVAEYNSKELDVDCKADTSADALCLLAITLIDKKIIK